MPRFIALLLVVLLGTMVFLPTAQAGHEWGHRYMIYGRILDADGDPAQGIYVRVHVETAMSQDPVLIIPTRCDGIFYTHTSEWDRWGGPPQDVQRVIQSQEQMGLIDGGALHIHKGDLPSGATIHIRTEFGNATSTVRGDMHRSHYSFQLEETVEPNPGCEGQGDWESTYVVEGRVQRIDGANREDLATHPDHGMFNEVTVTLQTTNGTVTETIPTNQYGDYEARFDNATVEDGARITATWDGNTRTAEADTQYRATELNIEVNEPLVSKTTLTVLGVLLAIGVVGGGGFYAYSKVRENIETKRLRESGVRKRANR